MIGESGSDFRSARPLVGEFPSAALQKRRSCCSRWSPVIVRSLRCLPSPSLLERQGPGAHAEPVRSERVRPLRSVSAGWPTDQNRSPRKNLSHSVGRGGCIFSRLCFWRRRLHGLRRYSRSAADMTLVNLHRPGILFFFAIGASSGAQRVFMAAVVARNKYSCWADRALSRK